MAGQQKFYVPIVLPADPTSSLEAATKQYVDTGDSARALISGQVFTGSISATNLSGTNTGDQTITLTGDVTGSGTGSFATTISSGVVTLAKMASLATNSLIGRSTAGTGVPEVITIGSGLSLSGGTLTATSSGGSVTSVALTAPSSILSVAGSPITTSGTLALSLATQSANTVFAGPTSGAAAAPTFRSLGIADLPPVTVNAQTGTTYTLVLTDAGGAVTMTNSAANTLTVPPNSSVAFPVGTQILVVQGGTGTTTIAAGAGVTVHNPYSLATGAQYAVLALIQTSANNWIVTGDINRTYGTGTVTSVSVVTANGVSGSVATATTTPAITLTLGAITPTSVAATGTVTGSNLTGTNTGDQTITLTGDVTGSGTGSFATTIANGAVTLAKMASLPNDTLIGRYSAGTGTPQVVTLGSGLNLSGSGVLTTTSSGGGPPGSVTSVALTAPSTILSVSGSPITSSGTLALSLVTQSAATVFAGPTSGTAAAPTFRALLPVDLPPVSINAQTGTTYTLSLSDAGGAVTMTNAAANTLTVPPNSSIAFPVGAQILVVQGGAGTTTIAAGAGVTINNPYSLVSAGQYSVLSLIQTALNTWALTGDVNRTYGTVTSVSVVTANGVSGSVATSTSTPAITLTLGDITPSSVSATGTVTGSNLSGVNTGDPPGYIDGLELQYVSAGSLTARPGTAYIPGLGYCINASSSLSISFSGNVLGFQHVYLYLSGSTPTLELSSTAPTSYTGSSRGKIKTGDSSRRYLGSINRSGAGGAYKNFVQYDNHVQWLTGTVGLVSGGTSTSYTTGGVINVTTARAAPSTVLSVDIRCVNTATSPGYGLSNADAGYTALVAIGPGTPGAYLTIPTSQQTSPGTFNYAYTSTPSGGTATIVATGYTFSR